MAHMNKVQVHPFLLDTSGCNFKNRWTSRLLVNIKYSTFWNSVTLTQRSHCYMQGCLQESDLPNKWLAVIIICWCKMTGLSALMALNNHLIDCAHVVQNAEFCPNRSILLMLHHIQKGNACSDFFFWAWIAFLGWDDRLGKRGDSIFFK